MYSALFLFDIDNTLIEYSSGLNAHKMAFHYAFKKVYSVNTSHLKINYSGLTDWNIALKMLALVGLNEEQVNEKINAFFDKMALIFKKFLPKYPVKSIAGAKEFLVELKKRNCLIGLVTGNVQGIALEKMKSLGLNDFFVLGGFGNQSKQKADLVRIALNQAKEFGFDNLEKTFIIGDTEHDISAAKANNVKIIAVQSGLFKDLKKYNPDFLFDNLENTNEILNALDLK